MTEPPKNAGGPGGTGPSANNSNSHQNDTPRNTIKRFLQVLFRPGDVFEFRAPKCRKSLGTDFKSTVIGYYTYDHIDAAADAIAALDSEGLAPGFYVAMNPVNPSLLARANNHWIRDSSDATSDALIVCRRWLFIDCDPIRASGISSTESERSRAEVKAKEIAAYLASLGWSAPVIIMSGNGYQLLVPINLPAADGGLVVRVLKALAAKFDDEFVKIDTTVANAARITKIPGTVARKGDEVRDVPGIEDRPHRRAELVSVPESFTPVAREQLEALASEFAPASSTPPQTLTVESGITAGRFASFPHTGDGVAAYLESFGIKVTKRVRKGSTAWLHLDRCPVVKDCVATSGSDISVGVGDDGKIVYKNQHNRGAGLMWIDVREALEPGYRAHAAAAKKGPIPNSSAPVTDAGQHWPEPLPLPDALPPVQKFDPGLLPVAVRRWIIDIAERVQCPIDFPAVAVMIAIASVVGRKIGIRPKRYDDWLVVPNLWGGVVGRPGVMKTPAISEPLKPLKQLEIRAKKVYDEDVRASEAAAMVTRAQKKDAEQSIRKALKDPAEAKRIAMESIAEPEGEPVRKRYVVNDPTVEKLGEILNQNPHGVLLYRDELVGWLTSLERPGQESARAFYLESWNGTGRFAYDRIGRGTVDIEAAIVSLVGCIQPGPLARYLRCAVAGGTGDDGLIQRLQLLVWPDNSKDWVNIDRWPDSEAKRKAYEVVEGLDGFDPTLAGGEHDQFDDDGIPFLKFDDSAQPEFDAWRAALEARLRSGDLHPALESHLSKFRSLIPSLALLIHLADGHRGPVGVEPVRMAIRWGAYLESHANRLYSHVTNPDSVTARVLAKHLLKGDLKDGFALREVYRKGWAGLGTPEDAKGAVDLLIDLDWLVEVRNPTTGRTGTEYFINPRLPGSDAARSLLSPKVATDTTDGSGASGGSVSGEGGGPQVPPPSDDWGVV